MLQQFFGQHHKLLTSRLEAAACGNYIPQTTVNDATVINNCTQKYTIKDYRIHDLLGAQLLYYIRLKNMTDIQFNSNSKIFLIAGTETV